MRRSVPATGMAKVAIFAAYCAVTNAAVLAWALTGTGPVWPVLALVVVASLVLGRVLPGWGFAGPAVGAPIWLAVIADDLSSEGAGLAVVALAFWVLVAEAAVLVGAFSAAWSWTRRAD
jgi:hypothetical protein